MGKKEKLIVEILQKSGGPPHFFSIEKDTNLESKGQEMR
jgi:hypothetical protein